MWLVGRRGRAARKHAPQVGGGGPAAGQVPLWVTGGVVASAARKAPPSAASATTTPARLHSSSRLPQPPYKSGALRQYGKPCIRGAADPLSITSLLAAPPRPPGWTAAAPYHNHLFHQAIFMSMEAYHEKGQPSAASVTITPAMLLHHSSCLLQPQPVTGQAPYIVAGSNPPKGAAQRRQRPPPRPQGCTIMLVRMHPHAMTMSCHKLRTPTCARSVRWRPCRRQCQAH